MPLPTSSRKSRNWCFTLNNPTPAEVEHLRAIDRARVRYVLYGEEVGESGTPHFQGFVIFKNPVRMRTVKKHVGDRTHLEPMKGNLRQNYVYCTKDGKFHELGERPMFEEEKGAKEKERHLEVIRLAEQGKFEEIKQNHPDKYLRYKRQIESIRNDEIAARELPTLDPSVRMQWYYGPSGTGKSRKARTENPHAFMKAGNKWWCGYKTQETVIFEDVDVRDSAWVIRFMKIWADIYPFQAEFKGGAMMIRPKMFIVTSNYHPKEIWTEDSDLQPILRRFHVTHFPSLGSVPINLPPPPQDQEEDSLVELSDSEEVIDLTQE